MFHHREFWCISDVIAEASDTVHQFAFNRSFISWYIRYAQTNTLNNYQKTVSAGVIGSAGVNGRLFKEKWVSICFKTISRSIFDIFQERPELISWKLLDQINALNREKKQHYWRRLMLKIAYADFSIFLWLP